MNHWFGVMCNVDAQVIALHFFENRLNGTFSETLRDLKHLKHLTITNGEREYEGRPNNNANTFKETLVELWNLKNLEEINMQWMELNSVIEPDILNLKKLRNLNFAYNKMVGGIPDSEEWALFT